MTARADAIALAVFLAVTGVVVVRAATAAAPPPARHATADERAMFAATIASQEEEWRGKAADDFASDAWSQRDAFHGHESNAVKDIARVNKVSYEEVFRAIDEDVHARPGATNRSADVVPCKPRPIFD